MGSYHPVDTLLLRCQSHFNNFSAWAHKACLFIDFEWGWWLMNAAGTVTQVFWYCFGSDWRFGIDGNISGYPALPCPHGKITFLIASFYPGIFFFSYHGNKFRYSFISLFWKAPRENHSADAAPLGFLDNWVGKEVMIRECNSSHHSCPICTAT